MEQLHNRVKAQETDPEVAAQEITGGKNLTLYEVDEATTRIREVDADANIIVGATFDRQCPPTPAARSYPGAGAVIQGVVNIVRPGNQPATLEFLRRDAHYRDTGATKCNSPTDWRRGTPRNTASFWSSIAPPTYASATAWINQ